jgi:hypothetical protein
MDLIGKPLNLNNKEIANLHCKGLLYSTVHRKQDIFEVHVDGDDRVEALVHEMGPKGSDKKILVAESTIEFLSLARCIGYVASHLRADVAPEIPIIRRSFIRATILDLK